MTMILYYSSHTLVLYYSSHTYSSQQEYCSTNLLL